MVQETEKKKKWGGRKCYLIFHFQSIFKIGNVFLWNSSKMEARAGKSPIHLTANALK